jgi:hypothetical protein
MKRLGPRKIKPRNPRVSQFGGRRRGHAFGPPKDLSRWGAQGGLRTARKYGKTHFAKIAKKRKKFGGGRPKKNAKSQN